MVATNQKHLTHIDKVNLGAFYTPIKYINIVWDFIDEFIDSNSVVLDSSCGYGNFFVNAKHPCKFIANDIDKVAIKQTKINFPYIEVFNKNALYNVSREAFNIQDKQKLIIIGNPPYNDTTSIIRNSIKSNKIDIDSDIKTRDYGISFLLSYNKLKADIICVLHPLSYLIKKSNFNLIKKFANNYKLIDGLIIDSGTFKETSKGISFPILIALYKRDSNGMDYDYIKNYSFKVYGGKEFKLNDFDYISNYIKKYPSKSAIYKEGDILFWTMRDINALKRNRTFVDKFSYNTIIVDKKKLIYYIYVDVFKQFSKRVPYYFGNLDVLIDDALFLNYKEYFIVEALSRHPFLKEHIKTKDINLQEARAKIVEYFKELLGEHFVY